MKFFDKNNLKNSTALRNFKIAALMLGVLIGSAMPSFGQKKSENQNVINTYNKKQAAEETQRLAQQIKEDKAFLRKHSTWVDQIPDEIQRSFKKRIMGGQQNGGTDMAQIFNDIRVYIMEHREENKNNTPNDEILRPMISTRDKGDRAYHMLMDTLKQRTSEYEEVIKLFSPGELAEYNSHAKYMSNPLWEKNSKLQETIRIFTNYTDDLYEADWLDRMPADDEHLMQQALDRFPIEKVDCRVDVVRNFVKVAQNNYSPAYANNPIQDVSMRATAIGEMAVAIATKQKQYDANQTAIDNNQTSAPTVTIPEAERNEIFKAAVNDYFDYKIGVIQDYKVELKNAKDTLAGATQKLADANQALKDASKDEKAAAKQNKLIALVELGDLLSIPEAEQLKQIIASNNAMNSMVAGETDPEFQEALNGEQTNSKEINKLAKAIEKKIEEIEPSAKEAVTQKYLGASINEAAYVVALDEFNKGTPLAELSQNKSDITNSSAAQNINWKNYYNNQDLYEQLLQQEIQYNSEKNHSQSSGRYVYQYRRSTVTTRTSSSTHPTRTGTTSSSYYSVRANKHAYEHNGTVGSSTSRSAGAYVRTNSTNEPSVRINYGVYYNLSQHGKGLPGLKQFLLEW